MVIAKVGQLVGWSLFIFALGVLVKGFFIFHKVGKGPLVKFAKLMGFEADPILLFPTILTILVIGVILILWSRRN